MSYPGQGTPLLRFVCAMTLAFGLAACGEDPPGGGGDGGPGADAAQTGNDATTGADGSTNPNDDGGTNPGDDGGNTGNDGGGTGNDGGADAGTVDTGPNPNNPNNGMLDSDCDGLSDAYEFSTVYANGQTTNPNNPDSDGDGIPDGVEMGVTTPVPGSNCRRAMTTLSAGWMRMVGEVMG